MIKKKKKDYRINLHYLLPCIYIYIYFNNEYIFTSGHVSVCVSVFQWVIWFGFFL